MSSLNSVRLPDGSEVVISEWLHQPVISTIEFDSAATVDLRAYNYVRGQNVSSVGLTKRQATDQDTNLVKKSAMNQDESLIVFAVTYEIFGLTAVTAQSSAPIANGPMLTADNLRKLQLQAMFELYVGAGIKKPQLGVPFSWLSQSIGSPSWQSGDPGTVAADAGTENRFYMNYGTGGVISGSNQRVLKLPIYIGGYGRNATPGNSMYFQGRFYNAYGGAFTDLNQDVRIRFVLDGLKKRPG